jgi:hypothetical protein
MGQKYYSRTFVLWLLTGAGVGAGGTTFTHPKRNNQSAVPVVTMPTKAPAMKKIAPRVIVLNLRNV